MAKIIGPGSITVDITGYAPRLPVAGETLKGTTLRFGPGGKGNNQMTAAHRAGAETKIIACRGDDFLGQILKKHYESEGMSEDCIKVDPNAETASALIEIDERDAQNRIIVILAANELVDRARVYAAEEEFKTADAVITQFETTAEAVIAAKELANKYGKPFVLNPAPCVPMPEGTYDGVDFITPNETEAELLTGIAVNSIEDCRKAAEKLMGMGVRNVIITLGSRGAFYYNGKEETIVPALRMKAVDTTGAGDAFNGGFVTALAEGCSVENALRFATCTAAISVTRRGAANAMPHREEILALMKQEFGVEL